MQIYFHMSRIFFLIAVTFLFCFFPIQLFAKFNPLDTPNNKYGIHIVDPNDISQLRELVNSSQGNWGYVTLVIQEDDRNREKWQSVFNTMRRDHLIPIVRLATRIEGDSWKKPSAESASDWVTFFNSLNWPIENRYVVLFNEPNHANEWGRTIDPTGYATLASQFTEAFHTANEDYFVMQAGFDVSASSDGQSRDAATFIKEMYTAKPDLFDRLDGWTSHSYPNPAFSGSSFASGRGTVRSYAWEREYLRSLGVTKFYPIFITETGWVHSFGISNNYGLLSPEAVGDALQQSAIGAWSDKNIVAITPFIFNYQGLPFDHFSWKKLGSNEYYPHYYAYQAIQKTQGLPFQRESFTLERPFVPEKLVMNSTVILSSAITNTGQSIISQKDGYMFTLRGAEGLLLIPSTIPTIEPSESAEVSIHLRTPNTKGKYTYTLQMTHNGRNVNVEIGEVTLIPPPTLTLQIQLGWKRISDTTDATVLIYDKDDIIHKIQGVTINNGVGMVSNLTNVIPNHQYRVVVLIPNYLPRQTIGTIEAEGTTITIPRMFPFDVNSDGAFTINDIWTMLTLPPRDILRLFITI